MAVITEYHRSQPCCNRCSRAGLECSSHAVGRSLFTGCEGRFGMMCLRGLCIESGSNPAPLNPPSGAAASTNICTVAAVHSMRCYFTDSLPTDADTDAGDSR